MGGVSSSLVCFVLCVFCVCFVLLLYTSVLRCLAVVCLLSTPCQVLSPLLIVLTVCRCWSCKMPTTRSSSRGSATAHTDSSTQKAVRSSRVASGAKAKKKAAARTHSKRAASVTASSKQPAVKKPKAQELPVSGSIPGGLKLRVEHCNS